MTLKEKIIKRLGGFTYSEYQALTDTVASISEASSAADKTISEVKKLLSGKTFYVQCETRTSVAVASYGVTRERPESDVKRELTHRLVDELLADGLVAFDVAKDYRVGDMVIQAKLRCLVPTCYASR